MIVQVRNLRPNRYRDLSICPIDREKVDKLKQSIKELSFWDNVIGRPMKDNPDLVELAYGYHRLIALEELGIEEVDIPVKDLSDEVMIKIMGQENREWYGKSTAIVTETVKVAKEFIEKEINTKCRVYKDLEPWCQKLFEGEMGFAVLLGRQGGMTNFSHAIKIGRIAIEKFLGDNWSRNDIQLALKLLEGETSVIKVKEDIITGDETTTIIPVKVSKEAAEVFPVVGQSRAFVDVVTKDEEVRTAYSTPESQLKLAEEIAKEINDKGERVTATVIAETAKVKAKAMHSTGKVPKNSLDEEREEILTVKKVPQSLKAVRNVYDKVHLFREEKKYPWHESVYTPLMMKRLLNMLYVSEFEIQKYRKEIEAYTGMTPDEEVLKFDCYPVYDPEEARKETAKIEGLWKDQQEETQMVSVEDYVETEGYIPQDEYEKINQALDEVQFLRKMAEGEY